MLKYGRNMEKILKVLKDFIKVVTYEEEDEWANVHYKIDNKENESSSV